MKTGIKSLAILSSLFLASCANQNTKITDNLMPTTNACVKLELIKKDYSTNFASLKSEEIVGRMSNMWKAKYQLFGENCQIFSWGGAQHTYSCNVVAPDEITAKKYYENAKKVTEQCLGDEWKLEESTRAHDNGLKAMFTHSDPTSKEPVTFSTQLIPSSGLFSTTWTLYYYIGNIKEPKS
ncbi:hypothetical protein [Colwellia sp. E2M01]|uniref:hypothetical protein n=1 Tax=Colwellia sp. E2M01 TaxID=2841561 RepID=UPI001C0889F6|nr:hypothetical protein [Colwellia sp. E2M01]MBU2871987.1 hypothetical protein [Colwellia sp. E2M01]